MVDPFSQFHPQVHFLFAATHAVIRITAGSARNAKTKGKPAKNNLVRKLVCKISNASKNMKLWKLD